MSERARTIVGLLILVMLSLNFEERVWRELLIEGSWHNLADFEYYYNGAQAYRTTGRMYIPMPDRRTHRHDFYTDAPIELKYYLFYPFTFLDLPAAKMAWIPVQHIYYLVTFLTLFSLWRMPVRGVEFACLVLLYDPTWQEVAKGQLTCLSMLAFLLAFRSLRKERRIAAGLWLGAACILKQHFLYYLPLLFLASGGIVPTLVCGAVLALAACLQAIIDPSFWPRYMDEVLTRNIGLEKHLILDFTTYSVITRWFFSAEGMRPLVDLGSTGLQIASYLPGILFGLPSAILVLARRHADRELVLVFIFAAMMVILPNMSMYGLLWNFFPLSYFLAQERWRVFIPAFLMTGVSVTIYNSPHIYPGGAVPYWAVPLPWVGMMHIYAVLFRDLLRAPVIPGRSAA